MDDDNGPISNLVGFHLRLAHGAAYRHFMETFAALDLTQKQVAVMWLVDDRPGVGQAELGRRLQMDRATVMAIVNRLQSRGYVVRGRSSSDKRRQNLWLTNLGEELLRQGRRAVAEHERWLKSRFTDREVERLIDMLARIHQA